MDSINVTIEIKDGKMVFPVQADVENIALLIDSEDGDINQMIYFDPIPVGNGIIIEWNGDDWELKKCNKEKP